MLKPGGYALWMDPEGNKEQDTFTCNHCNTVVYVKAAASPTEAGGWCNLCMRLLCMNCAGKECVPFEKKMEMWEKQDLQRRRLYGAMGIK